MDCIMILKFYILYVALSYYCTPSSRAGATNWESNKRRTVETEEDCISTCKGSSTFLGFYAKGIELNCYTVGGLLIDCTIF